MAKQIYGDRILVVNDDHDEEVTAGGIVLAKQEAAHNLAVGIVEQSNIDTFPVGTRVTFGKYAGIRYKEATKEYSILVESDVLFKG